LWQNIHGTDCVQNLLFKVDSNFYSVSRNAKVNGLLKCPTLVAIVITKRLCGCFLTHNVVTETYSLHLIDPSIVALGKSAI